MQGGAKISPHDLSGVSDSQTKKCFERKFINFQSITNCNITNFRRSFASMKNHGLSQSHL